MQNGLYKKLDGFMEENKSISYCMHEFTNAVNYVYPELKLNDMRSRDYLYYAKQRGSLAIQVPTTCKYMDKTHPRYQFVKSLTKLGRKIHNIKSKQVKKLIKKEIYICPHCNCVVEL